MVRLTHLKLENIRSYRTAEIAFREGVNAIVGQNGAGKSTILQAIGYALFDSLEGRKPNFIREGSASASITVRLAEDREGSSYEVVRELRKSGTADWFVFDLARDAEVCRGRQDVRFFVQDLCNTRLDLGRLYTRIIGIQQGEFARPFRLNPVPRQDHFSPLLEVEKYKEAYRYLGQGDGPKGTIGHKIHVLAEDIARLEGRLENRGAHEQELQDLLLTLARLEEEEEKNRNRLLKLAEISDEFEQLKHDVEQTADLHIRAHNNLASSRQQLKTADEELRRSTLALAIVESNQDDHNRHLRAQADLDQLAHELRALRDLAQQKVQLDTRLTGLQERLARCQDRILCLKQLAEQQTQLAGPARQYEELDRERIALQHRIGAVDALEAAETAARAKVSRRQSQVEQLTSNLELRRQTETKVRRQGEQQRELSERTVHLRQQVELADHGLEQVNQQLSMLKRPGRDKETEPVHLCPVCSQPIEEAMWLELVAESELEKLELNGRASHLAKELADCEQAAQRTKETIDRLQDTIAELPDEPAVERASSDLTIARHELDQVEEKLKESRELECKLQTATADMAKLEDGWTAFRDNQRQIDGQRDIEAEITGLEEAITSLEPETQSLNVKLARLANLEVREAALTQTLDTTRSAYENVLKNQDAAEQKPTRETRYRELGVQVEALATRLTEVTAEYNRCNAAYDADAHVAHQEEIRQLDLDSSGRQALLQETRKQLTNLNSQLEAMELLDAELAAKRIDHADWTQWGSDLEDMRNYIQEMGPMMTRILNQRISYSANIIHQELTNSSSAELTWDETFAITLKVLGRERAFDQLSGGEQMTAALAVNLAMLQELSTVGFAFFDEPTTNLDEDRRSELASRLNVTRRVPQLIVISHDDTFEAQVDHVIRVAKTGNESEIRTPDA